ncbi:MAG: arsenite methyltransferase [Planctomycetota bacterium]|jgi:SAM-dependent methyltransferase
MNERLKAEDPGQLREQVREGYAEVAVGTGGCCSGNLDKQERSENLGYSSEELAVLPEGANLGAGCGNPTASAEIQPGETVLDLGSGAGIDCFLAAQKVGPGGKVIGVDMTDEMLQKARANAEKVGAKNVEFRQGIIEELPVKSRSVDLILSNCVINLSPEKDRVFAEAYRVLKPGGRMLISDIVLEKLLPQSVVDDLGSHLGCVSGATLKAHYLRLMRDAGFEQIEVLSELPFESDGEGPNGLSDKLCCGADGEKLPRAISLKLRAVKSA